MRYPQMSEGSADCGLGDVPKTRLDFLGLSRIVQANGLVQIKQNGISLSVSIQAEPVLTVCTSACG